MQVFSKSKVGDPCIEAFMGFSHLSSSQGVLNNTWLSQDWACEGAEYSSQGQQRGQEVTDSLGPTLGSSSGRMPSVSSCNKSDCDRECSVEESPWAYCDSLS